MRDTDGCADDAGARILRLYVGGQQCEMINSTSSELFQAVTSSSLRCQLNKPEVGYFEASMLVSGQYGRAKTASNIFYVSPTENVYNFQTYAGNFRA